MRKYTWTTTDANSFRENWPCSDIPDNGWAIFAENGDLVDLSPDNQNRESGGGFSEFLRELQATKQAAPITPIVSADPIATVED